MGAGSVKTLELPSGQPAFKPADESSDALTQCCEFAHHNPFSA
jgi:hypothetical protein